MPSRSINSPANGRTQFFFAYRCRIWRELQPGDRDDDDESRAVFQLQQCRYIPQLVSRRWSIFHTVDSRQRGAQDDGVVGPGVVGLHPRLLPLRPELLADDELRAQCCVWTDDDEIDGVFEYTSGTTMPALHGGSMEGELEFEIDPSLPHVWCTVANFSCQINDEPGNNYLLG